MENKITPCLWFEQQIEEAAAFYTSVFKNGKTETVARYAGDGTMHKDSVLTIRFHIANQGFLILNGGPYFKFTPANSFFVGCETIEEFDTLWGQLFEGGMVLMEAGAYPFSQKYGWLQDKYGLSWQLGLCGIPQYIKPFLMFTNQYHGKAEEAAKFYCSVFEKAEITDLQRYGKEEGETEGTIKHVEFSLSGQDFMAMDSGYPHAFTFTEAVSFCVYCQTQAEIDHFWETLSAGGEKQPCGWLKDRFGISWQIIPADLEKMMTDKNPDKVKQVMQAILAMGKLDIEALREAFQKY